MELTPVTQEGLGWVESTPTPVVKIRMKRNGMIGLNVGAQAIPSLRAAYLMAVGNL